jgi:hypothetical protein
VVDERVQRFDACSTYKGPDDFTDADYDGLVIFAQQKIDAGLSRYSKTVACEDALNLAIKSFNNGQFDGKINANKFNVLLSALMGKFGEVPVQASKKDEKDLTVKPNVLRQLGIKEKDIPHMHQLKKRVQQGLPHLVRDKGKIKVKKD